MDNQSRIKSIKELDEHLIRLAAKLKNKNASFCHPDVKKDLPAGRQVFGQISKKSENGKGKRIKELKEE